MSRDPHHEPARLDQQASDPRQIAFWQRRVVQLEAELAEAHARADTLADWYDVAVRAWSRVRAVASAHGVVCPLPPAPLPGEVFLCETCQVAWVASSREPGTWEMQAEAAFSHLRNPDGTAPASVDAQQGDESALDVAARQAVDSLLRSVRAGGA